jgi:SRSO17 transposase
VDRNAEGVGSESPFAFYVEHVASTLGPADRRGAVSLLLHGVYSYRRPQEIEPIAARRVQGAHQYLHHFFANADWSQEALLRQVRTFVLPAIEKSGRIRAWIVDDTGFPKKGVHSVGVARQYCGQLGK